MKLEDIELALAEELASNIGSGWDVKKPGISFTPNVNRPYAIGTVILGRPDRVAFGQGGYYRTVGLYQIDLFWPSKDKESRSLLQKADTLKDIFFPPDNSGRTLTTDSGNIEFDKEPGSPPFSEDAITHLKKTLEVWFYFDRPPE